MTTGGLTFKWTGPGLAPLNRLARDVRTKGRNKAARVGAVKLKELWSEALPRTTTVEDNDDVHLADSIGIRKQAKRTTGGLARFDVGVTGLARFYAHIYEFGSKYMTGRRTYTTTMRRGGQQVFDAMGADLARTIKRHG